MKKNNLTLGLLAALLLSSTLAVAESDYPAADFQPKVLFHDSNYKPTQSHAVATPSKQTEVADSNYPAANFKPQVIFQDESVNASKASTTDAAKPAASKAPVVDSAYPAADFQPKVLYNDTAYKATTTSSAQNKHTPAPAVEKTASSATSVDTAPQKAESSNVSLIGIGILALIAGFLIVRQQSAKTQATNGSMIPQSKGNNTVTGVARYIETRNKNSLSGVAKYLAKQAEATKALAETKLTRVEIYLRNRS